MNPVAPYIENHSLPFIASTVDVAQHERTEYWRSVFNGLWGAVDIHEAGQGLLGGSLFSRKSGGLTFNRISFGHQQFERSHRHIKRLDAPFYSLTFPEHGEAIGCVGSSVEKLRPGHVYLLNTGLPSKLVVDREYATFNILIPTPALERRLGRQVDLYSRAIEQPTSVLEVARKIIAELSVADATGDTRGSEFLSEQLLDMIVYYLSVGGGMSEDSLARKAAREKISAYIYRNYRDPALSPTSIAEVFGISRSYLYKLFSDELPVMEQIKVRRLHEAHQLLSNRPAGQTLTRIAMNCGFSSSSEFSRVFKARFGYPPSRL
ncbi:MAG: helix-turn-helix domain-containing protein [Jhaorihella sp.]